MGTVRRIAPSGGLYRPPDLDLEVAVADFLTRPAQKGDTLGAVLDVLSDFLDAIGIFPRPNGARPFMDLARGGTPLMVVRNPVAAFPKKNMRRPPWAGPAPGLVPGERESRRVAFGLRSMTSLNQKDGGETKNDYL